MTDNSDVPSEDRGKSEEIVQAGTAVLAQQLPPKWSVQLMPRPPYNDLHLVLSDPGGSQRAFVVEARAHFAPSDARALLGSPLTRRLLRDTHHTPLLVIAPFLSQRTQELLTDEEHNYIDLTGNIRIAVEQPGLFIHVQGADRDPIRSESTRGLRGVAAGKVVHSLLDATLPVTVTEIAAATTVNLGYVSRILEHLATEALIDRTPRGPVTAVDHRALVRHRAAALGYAPRPNDTVQQHLAWLDDHDPARNSSSLQLSTAELDELAGTR